MTLDRDTLEAAARDALKNIAAAIRALIPEATGIKTDEYILRRP